MQSIEKFVEAYRSCWEATISGSNPLSELSRFFNTPCFMVSATGEMDLYATESEVEKFNFSRLVAFRDGGVQHANLRAVDVQSQGPHVSLATVNWELVRKDGSLERAWRHYYTILNETPDGSPKIAVSAFQLGS